jgi:hypothetical protein
MRIGWILPVTGAIISTALSTANGYGQRFAGRHRGTSAMEPCVVVMSSSHKANLKQIFSTEKQSLQTDRQNVASAKQVLVSAILSGSKDVSSQESSLASAQQQLQKDEDSTAEQVCSQLSSTQLSAAQTLFNNMTTLRANTRQQSKSYLQQAKAIVGDSQSQTGERVIPADRIPSLSETGHWNFLTSGPAVHFN